MQQRLFTCAILLGLSVASAPAALLWAEPVLKDPPDDPLRLELLQLLSRHRQAKREFFELRNSGDQADRETVVEKVLARYEKQFQALRAKAKLRTQQGPVALMHSLKIHIVGDGVDITHTTFRDGCFLISHLPRVGLLEMSFAEGERAIVDAYHYHLDKHVQATIECTKDPVWQVLETADSLVAARALPGFWETELRAVNRRRREVGHEIAKCVGSANSATKKASLELLKALHEEVLEIVERVESPNDPYKYVEGLSVAINVLTEKRQVLTAETSMRRLARRRAYDAKNDRAVGKLEQELAEFEKKLAEATDRQEALFERLRKAVDVEAKRGWASFHPVSGWLRVEVQDLPKLNGVYPVFRDGMLRLPGLEAMRVLGASVSQRIREALLEIGVPNPTVKVVILSSS
jgi:hypothetical protein